MISREDLVYMAKICEQAERFEDMLNYIRQVAFMEQELSIEERNLLSTSFKNCIGQLRSAWRIIDNLYTDAIQDVLEFNLNQVHSTYKTF